MRNLVRSIIRRLFGSAEPSKPLLLLPPPESMSKANEDDPAHEIEYGVGAYKRVVTPGFPERAGQPVPRWPEHGAALMAATPEELLQTQDDLVQRLRTMSPLAGARFNELIMPALLRYAAWVHLLPASENHHHSGPGGLLRHGLEVALHAARMAEGRHVGIDQPPSTRHRYEVRWRVATMFGGLLHDLGKPLVDCGATDADRTITWPAHAGDLYAWLVKHNLTHYRIYWRSGKRHERHKPVGTAVMREILGPELLTWLSDEPTHEVMGYLVTAVSNVASASNVMSMVVSKADSLSVEADLKRMALRTQATGTGASTSAAALVVGRLRQLVETNRIKSNRPGAPLWSTTEGIYGVYPAIIEAVIADLRREDIPSLPASRNEIAELLADTGFIEPCAAETSEGPQRSLTWDLRVELKRADRVDVSAPMKVLKFTEEAHIFGVAQPPPAHPGKVTSPFITDADARRMADEVTVADAAPALPEPATGAMQGTGDPDAAPTGGDANDANHGETVAADVSEKQDEAVVVEDRRNRRDVARERTYQREADGRKPQTDLKDLIKKINSTSLCGAAVAEVLRSIFKGSLTYGTDYYDTPDGLAIAYPTSFSGLGMPPEDILDGAVDARWVFAETGSDRMVVDRTFPDGRRRKCILFAGLIGQAWEALRQDHPEVLEVRTRPAPDAAAADATATEGSNAAVHDGHAPSETGSHGARMHPDPAPGQARARQAERRVGQTNGSADTPGAGRGRAQSGAAQSSVPSEPAAPQSAKASKPIRRKALDVPAVGAQAPKGTFQSGQPATSQKPARGSTGSQETPQRLPGPRTVACNLITELTPELIADINATVVLGVEQLQTSDPEFKPDDPECLRQVLRYMVTEGKVRAGPLLTALTTKDNPALLFKMPDSMLIKEIKAVRLNPNYERPAWIAERMRRRAEAVA
ncbi:MobH family relaxase [Luteimonas sp. MHLX1A]|uniref:MobH family relaxase n=1 Tax=Alterluteimonas muca TaxID=2878684 RepID=UPI001E41ECCC|nr:MobH family relaxase [Luteimonas sp. MHLX1A]MCD9046933.1 TraI domain-containing protein [Luteimonas sp. MHLX1A]